jgi:hypothetical protein
MNNESAFPGLNLERDRFTGDAAYFTSGGMTLRDWFAGQALTLFPRIRDYEELKYGYAALPEFAKFAYAMADAMLAAREEDKNAVKTA